MWLKLRKKVHEVHRGNQDFWLEGSAKPQITRNDLIKIIETRDFLWDKVS